MKSYDKLYLCAEGNFGLVTYAQADGMGISIRELNRWVKSGRLEKPARGVYRIALFPPSALEPYAVAVESIGPDAYLSGESVLQLLNLTPTNPGRVYVTSPRRVRKAHGANLLLRRGKTSCHPVLYEGIRCQHLADAIRGCRSTVRPDRRLRAVEEGERLGYLTRRQAEELTREIEDETSA